MHPLARLKDIEADIAEAERLISFTRAQDSSQKERGRKYDHETIAVS